MGEPRLAVQHGDIGIISLVLCKLFSNNLPCVPGVSRSKTIHALKTKLLIGALNPRERNATTFAVLPFSCHISLCFRSVTAKT